MTVLFMALPYPTTQFTPDAVEYKKDIEDAYGSVAGGCIALQEKVGFYKKDRVSVYNSKEKVIKNILAKMPTADEILEMLNMVELDLGEFYGLYGENKINTAIKYAKDLKDRYTVLWMNYDLFGDKI